MNSEFSDNLALIQSSFEQISLLERIYGDLIPWSAIDEGFRYAGEKVRLANSPRGIFKPRQMKSGLISIKTSIPRDGRFNVYDDHLGSEGYYQYSLQRGGVYSSGNAHLWQAKEQQLPFTYFHAVMPAFYKAIWPCFVDDIVVTERFAKVRVGNVVSESEYPRPPEYIESKYKVRDVKVRLHQASFRGAVLSAYGNRCAISKCNNLKLLEAAHIVPDRRVGSRQEVSNGIALTNLHHRAYDANLIGIDTSLRIHVSEELLRHSSNKFIQSNFVDIVGIKIDVPRARTQSPKLEFLEERFSEFKRGRE